MERNEFVLRRLGAEGDVLVLQGLDQVAIEGRVGGESLAGGELAGQVAGSHPGIGDGDALHLAGIHLVEELRIIEIVAFRTRSLALEQAEQGEKQDRNDNPDGKIAEIIHVVPLSKAHTSGWANSAAQKLILT